MLTGRETVAATFAATAHLHRDRPARIDVAADGRRRRTSWGSVVQTVRHATLALAGDGVGPGVPLPLDPASPPAHRATVLLVAAATGAVVTGGSGGHLDLESRALAGALVDDRHPDRFEVLVAGRDRHEVLLRADGVEHTHASLLVAARSFAQGAGVGSGDGVLVALRPGTAVEAVLATLVPALTGATVWTSEAGAEPPTADAGVTWTVSDLPPPAAPPPGRRMLGRRTLGRHRPAGARHLLVVGDGGPVHLSEPVGRVGAALSVEAAGGIVTGFGPPGTVGRPLPGVSVTVDHGEVLVRSCGTPPSAPGLRADGWLATGRHGSLEGGALVLEPGAPPSGRA